MDYKKLFISLLLASFFCATAFTQEKKIPIAIMDFRASNTDETLGGACSDMLAEKLFSSKLFILMEKSQMDKIARQNGFYEFNSTDPLQIQKLGKILNVEKLIAGSITFLDEYIITVKVFSAVTGEIDFTIEKRTGSIEKIDDAIADIAVAVERHYLGYYNLSGRFDVSAEYIYILPFGTMGDTVSRGMGGQVIFTVNSPFGFPADMQVLSGYYNFTPARGEIESYSVLPLYVNCSYRLSPARNIKFIPSAGAGYIFTFLSADPTGSSYGGIYDYSRRFHYNPSLLVRAEFDIFLADRWYITVTPQYNVFFVPGDAGQFASLALGARMLF